MHLSSPFPARRPELTLSNEVFRFFSYSRQCIRELEGCPRPSAVVMPVRLGVPAARPVGISHHHHCAFGGGLVDRHDPLCFVIAKCARAAGFPTCIQCQAQGAREPGVPGSGHAQFSNTRRIGFWGGVGGLPFSGSVSAGCFTAGSSQGHAASHREGEKQAKYAALAASFRRQIIGLVMESAGAFGKNLQEFISSCAAAHDEARCLPSHWHALARTDLGLEPFFAVLVPAYCD